LTKLNRGDVHQASIGLPLPKGCQLHRCRSIPIINIGDIYCVTMIR
jgi:hypothetical protein